jgi:hypothetical protein
MTIRGISILILLALSGCAVYDRPQFTSTAVVMWTDADPDNAQPNHNDVPTGIVAAPQSTSYTLNRGSNDLLMGYEITVATVDVSEGQPLGFEKNADGDMMAVAGTQHWLVTRGDWTWYRPETPEEKKKRQDDTIVQAPLLAIYGLARVATLPVTAIRAASDKGP